MCTTLGCILKTIPYPFLAFLPEYSLKKTLLFPPEFILGCYSAVLHRVVGGARGKTGYLVGDVYCNLSLSPFSVFSFDLRVADVATSIKS